MNDDLLLKQLREISYPGSVDVTDAVMDQVRHRPILVTKHRHFSWKQAAVAAVACVALAFGVNTAILNSQDYNVNQIGASLAEVYDYQVNYGLESESDHSTSLMAALYY